MKYLNKSKCVYKIVKASILSIIVIVPSAIFILSNLSDPFSLIPVVAILVTLLFAHLYAEPYYRFYKFLKHVNGGKISIIENAYDHGTILKDDDDYIKTPISDEISVLGKGLPPHTMSPGMFNTPGGLVDEGLDYPLSARYFNKGQPELRTSFEFPYFLLEWPRTYKTDVQKEREKQRELFKAAENAKYVLTDGREGKPFKELEAPKNSEDLENEFFYVEN